jgi:hypothetical protein
MRLATPPIDFPLLSLVLTQISGDKVGVPPDTRSIGERTYRRFESSNFTGDKVDQRDWRHVPYALWLDKNKELSKELNICNMYIDIHLPNALQAARRPMKWGRPLFFTYLEHFNPNNSLFEKLAQAGHKFFSNDALVANPSIRALTRDLNIFNTSKGPGFVANSVLKSKVGLSGWINNFELWPGFIATPFSQFAFNELLKLANSERRQVEYIRLVFDWGLTFDNKLRYPESRVKFAEALLLPWREENPPDPLKNDIIAKLLGVIGDPRIDKQQWYGVSSEAIQVLINWINGRTLDAFFRILQQTADEIWQYRQKFWQAYFKQGHIEEVWIALGENAHRYLRTHSSSKDLKCAKLTGATADQSVLLLKMGGIIFCEWSHNGRLRAQRVNARIAPKLYQRSYDAPDLRFESLDFNSGQNEDPGLVHFSSDTAGWQRRARNFINSNVGINVPLNEVT